MTWFLWCVAVFLALAAGGGVTAWLNWRAERVVRKALELQARIEAVDLRLWEREMEVDA